MVISLCRCLEAPSGCGFGARAHLLFAITQPDVCHFSPWLALASGLRFVVSPTSPSVLQLDGDDFSLLALSFPLASFQPTLGYKSYLTKPRFESEKKSHRHILPEQTASQVCSVCISGAARAASSLVGLGSVPGRKVYMKRSILYQVLEKEMSRFNHCLLESGVPLMRM